MGHCGSLSLRFYRVRMAWKNGDGDLGLRSFLVVVQCGIWYVVCNLILYLLHSCLSVKGLSQANSCEALLSLPAQQGFTLSTSLELLYFQRHTVDVSLSS